MGSNNGVAAPPDASGPSELGRIGEDAACTQYRARGYRVVARNWRCLIGELDLVALRGGTLVFCEVKARRSSSRRGPSLGPPFEAVTEAKQRKLRLLAEAFLAGSRPAPENVRFDVASVTVDGTGRADVYVFEHAF